MTGGKLKFLGEIVKCFFIGKEKKLNAFVLDRLQNLFSMYWMEAFDLISIPINTFCNNVDGLLTKTEKGTQNKFTPNFFRGSWILL